MQMANVSVSIYQRECECEYLSVLVDTISNQALKTAPPIKSQADGQECQLRQDRGTNLGRTGVPT